MAGSNDSDDLRVNVTNKQILSLALPITLAILIPQINLLTNSIFLGRLSEGALGNAGITGVFYLIFAVGGNALNNALQNVFSKNAGSGDTDKFRVILAQGIRISLQFSAACILFTLLLAPFILKAVADPASYEQEMHFLRIRIWGLPFLFLFQMGNAFLISSLNSRFLVIGFVIEAAINILFDYLLIFGHAGLPSLGFDGAAVASVIAEIVGMFAVFAVLSFTGLKMKYNLLRDLRYDKKESKHIIRVALPLVTQYIISVTTWLIFFLLLEGRGPVAKAISNVMRNVFGLVGIFVWAFAGTCNSMVSNLIGQGRYEDVMPAIKRIMTWSLAFCCVPVTILNIFPERFFGMFGSDAGFISTGVSVIRMVSLGIIFMSMANVYLNAVTGTGKTRVNLLIEIVAITLYLSYTVYFMKLHFVSLALAWSNEFIYWTAIFVMSFTYLRSGRWKRA